MQATHDTLSGCLLYDDGGDVHDDVETAEHRAVGEEQDDGESHRVHRREAEQDACHRDARACENLSAAELFGCESRQRHREKRANANAEEEHTEHILPDTEARFQIWHERCP